MKGQSSTFKKKTIIEIIAVAILVVIAIASIVIFLKDRISSEAIDKDNQTEQIDNNQKADDNSNQNNGQEPDGTNQENNQNSGNNANNNNENSNNNSNNSNGNNKNNTNNNTGVTTGSNVNEIGETTVERVEEREKLVSRDYWDWWKPTTISVNSTVANIVPALPDITVTKTAETDAGNKLVYAGEKITYTIVVKNNGNQDVEKIEVMDKIPSNTTFDSVENEGIVVKSSKAPEKVVGIKWIITVKAGEEVSLKFTVVVDSGVTGTITNKAIANGEESNEENTSIITSNKTSEILRYNKETNKFETVNVAKIDDEITYTISVTNTGDENGTTKIVDTVPEGTVLKRGSAEGAEISENHKTVTWNDVEVPAGETVERTFTVIVKDIKSLENKKITNIATVGEKETNETENSTAEINVEKTVIDILRNDESIGLDAEVKEGDVIKYKITVTNTGSEDLTNVIVDEKLEGIELNEKELNIGNLKAGENKEIFASYTVSYEKNIKENVGKLVHNEVKVTGETIPTDPDKEPEKVEDKDEIDTSVADAPSVDISKVATRVKENGSEEFVPVTEKTKVRPGDVIEYVITVTNTGNVTLENIKVTDSLKVTVNGEVKDVDENGTSIIAEIKELSAEAGKNVETITTYYTVVESDVVEEKPIMNTATVIIPDVPGKDSAEEVPVNPDTSVSGTKIWKDNGDAYVTRPEAITINLLQNGEKIDSKTVGAADNWFYTFDKLPKYDADGKEYTYTITENEVAGYVTEISGNDVINTVTGITEVSGTKTWKDNNNEYKTRPTSIVINLLQNGEKFDSKKVVATDDWAYEFKNLPEYDKDGVKYNYTVTEEEVTGYVTEISGYDVINTLTGTTSVNAIKIWQDNNNTYGTRPESIIINLLQNGKQIDSKEIGESSDWAYEFKNLPEYDKDGVKYNYSLTEENIAGYVTEISGYDVINTLTGKTDVSGTKIWVDGGKTHNNSKEITLVLTRKSEKVESVEETVEAKVVWNGNTYTFSDLDKYDAEGYLYIYKVTENKVNDYTTEQDENNFTNTMSEINDKIEISGTKTWVDGGKLHDNAKEIILVLTRASAKSGSVEEKVEATPTWNGNTYTFSNLSKYDAKGYLYTYKVSETEIKGYDTTTSGNNFTNTMSEINDKIEISGTKTWVDGGKTHNNTTEITLVLTRTSTKTGSVEETIVATPTWDGNTYTFSNLAKYDTEGYLYEYKVSENVIDGYTTNVDGRNFINTMSNINDKINVTGTKTWVDGGKTHINSEEIALTLTRTSAKVGSAEETVEVTPAWNGNIYTFSNLAKYDAEGYLYTYKVSEAQIRGYDTTTSGNNFTNTMSEINDKIEISGTKTWVDGGKTHNNAGEITLVLTRISTKPGSVEETVEATVVWDGNTYSFSNLAKYDTEGYLYEYKVSENAIKGYTTNVDGRNFINIMSNIDDKINVTGTKTWVDGGKTHINSEEIALTLTRTSAKVGSAEETVEVTPAWNGNTYTFNELSKYDTEGYLYTYKVVEDAIDGYTTVQDGRNFTNTMSEINDKIEISGTKTWIDGGKTHNNATEIVLTLTRTSTKTGSVEEKVEATVVWNGNTYTFNNLAKYDTEGYLYEYKVSENAIDGYTTRVNGRNFINIMSNIDETTNVTGTKTWIDGGKTHINSEEISLTLTRTSAKPGSVKETVEVTPTWNGNTYTFNGLPKYDTEGYLYTYEVSESKMDGYTTISNKNNFINIISSINNKFSITGTKTWIDGGKAHNNATEIVLTLTRTSTKPGSVEETVVATPTWDGNTYTFSELNRYDSEGYLYEYKVAENPVKGYTTRVDGRNFINIMSNIDNKMDVTGTKTWVDGGKTHINSEEIALTLTRTSAKVGSAEETVEVTPAWNGNIYTFSNLAKYDAEGYLYTYKVSEAQIRGYDTTTSGNNFTNTMSEINDKIEISGTKTWVDGGKTHNNAGEITLVLTRISTKPGSVEETVEATVVWDGNTYTFSNLAKYDTEGYLYKYKVTENAINEYTTKVDGRNFINIMSNIDETINVTGTKTWVDGGKQHNNATEITLALTRISAKARSVEETVEVTPTWDGNTYTFNGLSKYDVEGYLYTYKVSEVQIKGYDTTTSGNNFTNTMSNINDKIDVTGTKTWVDGGKTHNNAKEIILVLTRTSTKTGSVEETVVATPTWDGNTYTFNDLAKYDTEGYLYEYKVVENAINGYTTVQDGRNFINTISDINEKINVIGTKTWIDGGIEHDNTTEITLVLTRTSTKSGSVEETVEVTPTWDGSTYTFSNLAKYDAEGYLYEYKVAENPVDGYTTKVNGYNFTNTMSEINDTIDISGTKIWEDNKNAYGTRPTSIIVNLLQNGTKVASKRVTSADNWRYSFTDMPKYDAEGYPYTYTVTENAVSNYDTSVNGYNITNRLKLSLNKKATDKNGNIITELIYDSKSEASRKFNYVLTVTGQGQQKVTDVLPSGIVIEDNWSADNVTVTTDTTTGRQKITWNVNLTDDAADELIIPVIATEKIFEGKETESETVKSVLNLNFHKGKEDKYKGNKDYNSKKVNIFLRALGNADPSTDDGYIYAGQTTIATRYINEIKNASGQAKFVSGYDDAKVNSILSTKNTTQIEKMLTDFSKDNESSTGLGKYISGGLPSVATIRQNIKTLYSDKIELTDTQVILWYKVPYSVDEEVARNYVITDKENGNKKLVDKPINLPNCGYHIDGLIVDIKDLGGYIPEGTKVSVKNVANLGKMASEATVDIIYEKKLSESKVSSQELVSDDIEVNVEENIKQSEEPISKVEEKKVVNEETTKTDITTPSNMTKNVVSNTEQVVEKKDDEKVTASKESKFTVETSED